MYLAHSARKIDDSFIPAQLYETHAANVLKLADKYGAEMAPYLSEQSRNQLLASVHNAANFHDLGKLHPAIQAFLHHPVANKRLPFSHFDAGTQLCRQYGDLLAAISIFSHHAGLPDFQDELASGYPFRDKNGKVRQFTDDHLRHLENIHNQCCNLPAFFKFTAHLNNINFQVLMRMILSCLADGDHTDTAQNYNPGCYRSAAPELNPEKRLLKLDQYVSSLGTGNGDKRNLLRQSMYTFCRMSEINGGFASCDSPVGSGKTTAVMAHLLRQAQKRHLRRIFVVLPFTNIITQSVETYRKALVLPGEDPSTVVAELHHNVDFENEDLRYLTALWRAPIVVTTAVAFFETLASNKPSALRRLHELPGSAVFLDESHAALPVHLWPLAWKWMSVLSKEWSCYWVLASGSQTRFWDIDEISGDYKTDVPEIVDSGLRDKLSGYEQHRVTYKSDLLPKSIEELIKLVMSKPGPRLVIMNTVQSAAVVAQRICQQYGRERVEHISTSLTPADREKTIAKVKSRLLHNDDNWVLVATSCVEAGVDFSFRSGFRELGTLVSLLQASGRVNRNGKYHDSEMWTFCMKDGEMLTKNPGLKYGAMVLRSFLEKGITPDPSLCNEAMREELSVQGDKGEYLATKLMREEENRDFKTVCEKYHVIDNNSATVLIDPQIVDKINHGKADWKEIQRNSVQIHYHKVNDKFNLPLIKEELYFWDLGFPASDEIYNGFLGYMQGVLLWEKKKDAPVFL